MRHDRLWALLTVALLNIFALTVGLVVRDVIASRPPEPLAHPVVRAEEAPAPMASGGVPVDPGLLADTLDDRMSSSGLGDDLYAYVADAETATSLFAQQQQEGAVPASTTKLVTAVAVLHAADTDERLATTVVQGADPGRLILVGGGDPTLTETADARGASYPRLATLSDLAAATAARLRESGVDSVTLGYDSTHYTGSTTAPGWKPGYVYEGSVSTVHALMIDGGRVDKERAYSQRFDDPPQAAAEAFARQLEAAGISVEGEPAPAEAAAEAATIATVESPTIAALVEKMLLESENNIAEALAHHVAVTKGMQPSFEGAEAAVAEVMTDLGIEGVHVEDGSGLSVNNRITPKALVELLLLAADPQHPELHYVLSGLPTAHFTGTLDDRYAPDSDAAPAAGLVRAKTGTLNGVSTLAGLAYDAEGRLLAFAFMANAEGASIAELAQDLDTFAATIARCDCS
ncbi:D-alanyl-D-alanine carboxypeptidase/D-alanyl-D-alanine endopeptidase [Salinactinospora qingdaonensis]|uniref:D-alanyl-D-alanine carboxypeptidase/D-alanyl-D-alanine-endopeptidase n=1 Tax=Salinactinospora qingdaonensis TaxID=702744 RepID=A0ABP7G709_9ACTN